jgi:hypothetical protein
MKPEKGQGPWVREHLVKASRTTEISDTCTGLLPQGSREGEQSKYCRQNVNESNQK